MKNILKTIFMLLIIISMKVMSQTLNLTSGANNLNPDLDRYVGSWKWEGNGKTFIWVMKKQNIQIPPFDKNIKADIIYGFHKYMEGNTVVENSLEFANTIFGDKKSTIFGGMGILGTSTTLEGSIEHLTKNRKNVNFIIEYLDPTHIKLVLLKNPQGVRLRLSSEPPFDWSISLPDNIILTKQ